METLSWCCVGVDDIPMHGLLGHGQLGCTSARVNQPLGALLQPLPCSVALGMAPPPRQQPPVIKPSGKGCHGTNSEEMKLHLYVAPEPPGGVSRSAGGGAVLRGGGGEGPLHLLPSAPHVCSVGVGHTSPCTCGPRWSRLHHIPLSWQRAGLPALPCGCGGPPSPKPTPCLGRGLRCSSTPAAMQEFSTTSTTALEEPIQTEGMSRCSNCTHLGTFSPIKNPLGYTRCERNRSSFHAPFSPTPAEV